MINRLLAATACLLLASLANGQAQPQRALVIELPSDLDTAASSEQFEEAIREAVQDRYDLIVLELAGQSARLDVIHRMADALRRSAVPSIACLGTPRGASLGPGQLILALFATRGVAASSDLVVRGSLRERTDALAPPDTPFDVLALELMGRLGEPLDRRAIAGDLSRVLVQGGSLAMIATGDRPRLIFDDPAPAGAVVLSRRENGAWNLMLNAEHVRRIGLADEVIRPREQAWRPRITPGPVRITIRRVSAPLSDALTKIEGHLAEIDSLAAAADKTLDAVEAGGQKPGSARYRQAADEADRYIEGAREHLVAVEALIRAIPEILRTPAPGQSAVERPSAYATRWRTLIRRRADALTTLEARAREFASK
jgi:hypothetical protein